jgi:hypothetical protein
MKSCRLSKTKWKSCTNTMAATGAASSMQPLKEADARSLRIAAGTARASAESHAHASECMVKPGSSAVAAMLSLRPQDLDAYASEHVDRACAKGEQEGAAPTVMPSPRNGGGGELLHEAACMPAQLKVADWMHMKDGPLKHKLQEADGAAASQSGAHNRCAEREEEGRSSSELFLTLPSTPTS